MISSKIRPNDQVSIAVKTQMMNKLCAFNASSSPAAVIGNGLVQIPVLHKSTLLPDLMGPDLFSFFDILLQFGILQHSNPRVWHTLKEYRVFQSLNTEHLLQPMMFMKGLLGWLQRNIEVLLHPSLIEQMDNIIK